MLRPTATHCGLICVRRGWFSQPTNCRIYFQMLQSKHTLTFFWTIHAATQLDCGSHIRGSPHAAAQLDVNYIWLSTIWTLSIWTPATNMLECLSLFSIMLMTRRHHILSITGVKFPGYIYFYSEIMLNCLPYLLVCKYSILPFWKLVCIYHLNLPF